MDDFPESSLSPSISSIHLSSEEDELPLQNSFSNLSHHLEQLLLNPSFSDAVIVFHGAKSEIHRCILAARSNFFQEMFQRGMASSGEGKPEYILSDFLPYGNVSYDAFSIVLVYMYTGKFTEPQPECADSSCNHEACKPAINFYVELLYAASIFELPELYHIFHGALLRVIENCEAEDTFPILTAAHHCSAPSLLTKCEEKLSSAHLDTDSVKNDIPEDVAKRLQLKSTTDERIKRIYQALDNDDVDLMRQLISESGMKLGDTYALHYAVANCASMVVEAMLDLNEVDINLRNTRGYTALHIAAMRREPYIILSLLEKGARASDLTSDGRSAPSICRRITALKDSKDSNKYSLCISVLESQMNRPANKGCSDDSWHPRDIHNMLLHFEIRVTFARILYPDQARLAMRLANADKTEPYDNVSARTGPANVKHSLRLQALLQTVRNGRQYFSNCASMIDNWMILLDDTC